MENPENRGIGLQRGEHMRLIEDQSADIDDAIAQKELAAHPKTRSRDRHFNSYRGHDQRLVIGKTDSVKKKGPIKIPILMWRIAPPENAKQYYKE